MSEPIVTHGRPYIYGAANSPLNHIFTHAILSEDISKHQPSSAATMPMPKKRKKSMTAEAKQFLGNVQYEEDDHVAVQTETTFERKLQNNARGMQYS